jgi:hypothetical protein
MKSEVADYAEQKLIEAASKLTHEQRLAAFVEHCRQIAELHRAGQELRQAQSPNADSTTS